MRAEARRVARALGERRGTGKRKRGRREAHRPEYRIVTGRLLHVLPRVRIVRRGVVVHRCWGPGAERRARLWIVEKERT